MNDEPEIDSIEALRRFHDRIEVHLSVGFTVAPKHLRNAFTGVNQRRRRDPRMMREFADWYSDYVCRMYLFYQRDDVVPETEIRDFLYQWMLAVPDDVAKACGGKIHAVYDPFRKKTYRRTKCRAGSKVAKCSGSEARASINGALV